MVNVKEEDAGEWHHYFAATTNNRAWGLSTSERTEAENLEMLNAAHASAFHWSSIGKELNNMRATMLLAEVHSRLGMGPSAYAYATEMYSYFTSTECPDWELAFAFTIHAHAASVSGHREEHQTSYSKAEQAIAAIEDEEDRAVVLATFNSVPKPSIGDTL